jgi:hypothetical protein
MFSRIVATATKEAILSSDPRLRAHFADRPVERDISRRWPR